MHFTTVGPQRIAIFAPTGRLCALPQLAVWDFWRDFARARGIFLTETKGRRSLDMHAGNEVAGGQNFDYFR
jgi:hypothetical protein